MIRISPNIAEPGRKDLRLGWLSRPDSSSLSGRLPTRDVPATRSPRPSLKLPTTPGSQYP